MEAKNVCLRLLKESCFGGIKNDTRFFPLVNILEISFQIELTELIIDTIKIQVSIYIINIDESLSVIRRLVPCSKVRETPHINF